MDERIKTLENKVEELESMVEELSNMHIELIKNMSEFISYQTTIHKNLIEICKSNTNSIDKMTDILFKHVSNE